MYSSVRISSHPRHVETVEQLRREASPTHPPTRQHHCLRERANRAWSKSEYCKSFSHLLIALPIERRGARERREREREGGGGGG